MKTLPPVAAVLSFVDAINRGDVTRRAELMADDHELHVFSEARVIGRQANLAAWRGYCDSFPDYIIYPRVITESSGEVSVLGHTTGSHLGLPDSQERNLTLIWRARVANGRLLNWTLVEDNAANRQAYFEKVAS